MSSNVSIPAVCYATCNNAYLEAQELNNTAALCAEDSPFAQDYSACQACVVANSGSQSYLQAEFAHFLDYCASSGSSSTDTQPVVVNTQASTETVSATFTSPSTSVILGTTSSPPTSVTSGSTSLVATGPTTETRSLSTLTSTEIQSLQNSPNSITAVTTSSSSGTPVATITTIRTDAFPLYNGSIQTVTYTDIYTLYSTSLGPNHSPSSTPGVTNPSHQSKAWIAGAVIGPIAGFIIFIGFICWIVKRRKTVPPAVAVDEKPEKAQLHADSVPLKKQHELEGSRPAQIAELEAVEPVGTELP